MPYRICHLSYFVSKPLTAMVDNNYMPSNTLWNLDEVLKPGPILILQIQVYPMNPLFHVAGSVDRWHMHQLLSTWKRIMYENAILFLLYRWRARFLFHYLLQNKCHFSSDFRFQNVCGLPKSNVSWSQNPHSLSHLL